MRGGTKNCSVPISQRRRATLLFPARASQILVKIVRCRIALLRKALLSQRCRATLRLLATILFIQVAFLLGFIPQAQSGECVATSPADEWVPDKASQTIHNVHLLKFKIYNVARPPAAYSSEEEQENVADFDDDDFFDEMAASLKFWRNCG